MISRLALATYIVAAGLMTAACQKDTRPLGPISDPALDYPHLTITEPSLQKVLGFQRPIVRHTGDGLMQVTVPVRPMSNDELHVEYKPVWLDASGTEVEPQQSWRYIRLEPRQPAQVVVNATSARATDYNIQFRWARP